MRFALALLLLTGCASIPESIIKTQAPRAKYELVEGDPMYKMVAPGAIPPIDRPTWATAAEAEAFLEDDEPVLVVEYGGEVRVYSTWHLEGHEIVNDDYGDDPLLVSW